ncbi:MAG: hypothetical protein N3B18_01135 [Desulfobacterota bacterium]|nr:hypothetical protein [Thermodesulfobacteriota bacterium]
MNILQRITVIAALWMLTFLFWCGPISAQAAPQRPTAIRSAAFLDKDYFLLLFGFKFLLPEFVTLDLNDNGTFSLSSDLFDAPAKGNYNRGICFVKGNASTGIFYDVDFEEQIVIDYTIVGLPIGLRAFYLMGIGKREFTFLSDNFKIVETFIFQGPGFQH